ncbi:MAG: hypothetical protein HZA46_00860 [Planctomycetales bacterium]|nr:hypothetical protein [Planctomycetales bacterium]
MAGNTYGTGRHLAHGIVVGSILFVAAVANMFMLPYPIWFWGLNLVVLPGAVTLGAKLERAPLSETSLTKQ